MLYDNIKKCAKEKGMTINELEQKAGLSRGHMSKWKLYMPTVNSLQKVANVLEVTMDELVKE